MIQYHIKNCQWHIENQSLESLEFEIISVRCRFNFLESGTVGFALLESTKLQFDINILPTSQHLSTFTMLHSPLHGGQWDQGAFTRTVSGLGLWTKLQINPALIVNLAVKHIQDCNMFLYALGDSQYLKPNLKVNHSFPPIAVFGCAHKTPFVARFYQYPCSTSRWSTHRTPQVAFAISSSRVAHCLEQGLHL